METPVDSGEGVGCELSSEYVDEPDTLVCEPLDSMLGRLVSDEERASSSKTDGEEGAATIDGLVRKTIEQMVVASCCGGDGYQPEKLAGMGDEEAVTWLATGVLHKASASDFLPHLLSPNSWT